MMTIRNRSLCSLLLIVLLCSARIVAAEETTIFRADFETDSVVSPPSGWSMWGAQQYKDAENFTRDEHLPHQGKACFRIHHPANTGGYVVSAPESSIRPQADTMLTATFWARSDKPGVAVFSWTAYRQVQPFVDAGSPGSFPIQVDRQWKQFRFVLVEGWDFFADDCRHLLLTFRASGRDEEERTLWIDDVVVTQQASKRDGRLVNPALLEYTPLEHALQPGRELAFTVDASRPIRETYREVGGVSFHRVGGWTKLPFDSQGRYVLPRELEEAVRQLRLPMTRFYALGDEPFGLKAAIDRAAELLERTGIPAAATPLEFEIQSASSSLSPESWAAGVRHSVERGYPFHRWEIANEPYVGQTDRAFPTADSYLQHFVDVSRSIRAVDGEAKIGLSINHSNPAWGNYLLKQAAGHYDFVVAHYYSFADVERSSFEDIVLTGNYLVLDEILKTNALLQLYNPNGNVCQYDTEWGMHSSGPQGERADYVKRNANIYGMTHRAVRLIHYLREGMLRGASCWAMFTYERAPGFGVLAKDAPQKRSMNYWLYYYFNRHAGRWVLPLEGTAPYHEGVAGGSTYRGPLTPAVATLSDDRQQVFLMLANGSWDRDMPCRIDLPGFPFKQATGVVLSHSDPDGNPFLEQPEDLVSELPLTLGDSHLSTTIPRHSVVFLTLQKSTKP